MVTFEGAQTCVTVMLNRSRGKLPAKFPMIVSNGGTAVKKKRTNSIDQDTVHPGEGRFSRQFSLPILECTSMVPVCDQDRVLGLIVVG